jgi:hypothetical protein
MKTGTYENGHRLPKAPIFLDSPMAERVLDLYPRLVRYFSEEVQAHFLEGRNPFRPKNLEVVESAEASKALNRALGPMVVIAGSGMLSGGRILHHLKHGLKDPQNALVFVGYQPRGGLGGDHRQAGKGADPGRGGPLEGQCPHPGGLLRACGPGRASLLAGGAETGGPGPRRRGEAFGAREAPRPQGAGGEPGDLGGRGSGLKPSLSKTMRVAGLLLRV